MKKMVISIVIILLGLLCFKCTEDLYRIRIYNFYDKDILLYIALKEEEGNTYPDTSISFTRRNTYREIKSEERIIIDYGYTYEKLFSILPADTLSFYLFDKDTFNTYSWQVIQEEYKILQRYDLSNEDLKYLDYDIPYPPSEEMRYMKMYPPF